MRPPIVMCLLSPKCSHRHLQGVETGYAFTTVEQLMADFWSDVRAVRDSK